MFLLRSPQIKTKTNNSVRCCLLEGIRDKLMTDISKQEFRFNPDMVVLKQRVPRGNGIYSFCENMDNFFCKTAWIRTRISRPLSVEVPAEHPLQLIG